VFGDFDCDQARQMTDDTAHEFFLHSPTRFIQSQEKAWSIKHQDGLRNFLSSHLYPQYSDHAKTVKLQNLKYITSKNNNMSQNPPNDPGSPSDRFFPTRAANKISYSPPELNRLAGPTFDLSQATGNIENSNKVNIRPKLSISASGASLPSLLSAPKLSIPDLSVSKFSE
jgi:hypothetical protein